ncbi:MAG: DUF368 domain-containing protein [Erysipelothrix sp.]|nr:DUF368 domain-containing protein [Erysipelothrix sp.]
MISIFKGAIVALSMLVPGVSGGTMMIVLNIYKQTIEALDGLTHGQLIHKRLMLKLITGGLIGLFGFGWILLYLMNLSKVSMYYLFMGIVIMGAILLFKKISLKHLKTHHIVYLIVGAIIATSLTFLPEVSLIDFNGNLMDKLFLVIFGGVIVAIALILPGISTSYLLLVMGLYEPSLNAIKTLDIQFLTPMAIGVVIGILLTTRFLNWLLINHPLPTYLMIIGFMIGSIPQIFPGLPSYGGQFVRSILLLTLGIVMMVVIDFLSQKENLKEDEKKITKG